MSINDVSRSMVVVAVDVGKNTVALSVTDADRHRLLGPVDFAMTKTGLCATLARVQSVLPASAQVRVGIEAAGHYHRPLLTAASWPTGWELVELNPAHVTEQRRVQGRRRVKTDAIDLEAITELVLAGRGSPVTAREQVIGELTAWSAHRTRRVQIRTATKNQLLGQLDRSFPGLTLALPDVLGTKVGRLVAEHFADPARLTGLGETRFTGSLPLATYEFTSPSPNACSLLHVTPCHVRTRRWPGRCWPPTWSCSPSSTSKSSRPRPPWLICCP